MNTGVREGRLRTAELTVLRLQVSMQDLRSRRILSGAWPALADGTRARAMAMVQRQGDLQEYVPYLVLV